MIQVKRLRHVTFITPDMGRQIDYYQSVLGLGVIASGDDQALLATDSDELAVVLQRGDHAVCQRMSFEVAPDLDVADLVKRLTNLGLAADVRSDPLPIIARSVLFRDFEGMEIELLIGPTFASARQPVGGIAADRLGHVALYTQDPRKASTFYADILGFRVSDWIEEAFVFMRCNFDHHSVNFARSDERRLHHVAFELRDASHMHRACDLLGRRKMPILWGPVRHGPGHNVAIYHRDPDGHLVELFYDLDQMMDEELGYFEPHPWHRDRPQRPKVWVGLPRDIWGPVPSAQLSEFARNTT